MKIWYQSAAAYRYDAVWEEWGKTVEKHIAKVVRPDTEVYIAGVPLMMEIDKYKSIMYYHKSQILNNMLKAEKEGYDAVVVGCTLDPGVVEGKEMLNIPVVGISEASFHVAAMLGQLFAVVTIGEHFREWYRQQVEQYGLQSRHLQGNYYFDATEEEVAMALKNPEPIIEKFKATAKKAIADGASVIIPSPAFLATLLYNQGLTKLGDVVVLHTVSVAVKTAEMMVDLKKIGIEVCRKFQVYGSPPRELLEKYRGVFKLEL